MNRIKELREQKGIGQKVLAIDIGVTQPTVCDWEIGRKVPSSKSAAKLADYFGVSMDYLLGRDNAPLPPRDERDIAKDMQRLREKLSSGDAAPLSYNGVELDDNSRELLLAEVEIMLRRLKIENKEKYNPHKKKKG